MSFGRLGSLGRGFGRFGVGGRTGDPIIPGTILARTGFFSLTGNDAGLIYSLIADVGSFTFTGNDVAFTTDASTGGGGGGSTPTYHIYFF